MGISTHDHRPHVHDGRGVSIPMAHCVTFERADVRHPWLPHQLVPAVRGDGTGPNSRLRTVTAFECRAPAVQKLRRHPTRARLRHRRYHGRARGYRPTP